MNDYTYVTILYCLFIKSNSVSIVFILSCFFPVILLLILSHKERPAVCIDLKFNEINLCSLI